MQVLPLSTKGYHDPYQQKKLKMDEKCCNEKVFFFLWIADPYRRSKISRLVGTIPYLYFYYRSSWTYSSNDWEAWQILVPISYHLFSLPIQTELLLQCHCCANCTSSSNFPVRISQNNTRDAFTIETFPHKSIAICSTTLLHEGQPLNLVLTSPL